MRIEIHPFGGKWMGAIDWEGHANAEPVPAISEFPDDVVTQLNDLAAQSAAVPIEFIGDSATNIAGQVDASVTAKEQIFLDWTAIKDAASS